MRERIAGTRAAMHAPELGEGGLHGVGGDPRHDDARSCGGRGVEICAEAARAEIPKTKKNTSKARATNMTLPQISGKHPNPSFCASSGLITREEITGADFG